MGDAQARDGTPERGASPRRRSHAPALDLLAFAAAAFVLLYFLIPYLRVPFVGRDEALYAVFGQHASSSFVLYRDFWDNHFPGLYYIYALALPLHGGMFGVRIVHLIYQFLGVAAFYVLARRMLRPAPARLAMIAYAFYAVSPLLEANNATAEPFLLLPAFLGLSVSLSGRRRDDLLAGFLLGLATLMKQNGAFLLAVPVLATAALSKERGVAARVREAAWRIPFLGAGWLVPLAAAGLYFAAHRALGDFLYETITFMMTQRLGDTGVLFRIRDSIVLSNTVLRDHPFLPAGALASLALLLPVLREREPVASGAVAPTRTPRASVLWTFIWLAVSAAMVSAGGRPFPHYLQLLVPPLCLLGFLSIQELWPSRGTAPGRAALLVVAGFLFLDTGAAMVRGFSEYFGEWTFRDRPFTWAEVPVGEEIRSQTSPGETILVWGPKPAVYYFAQRSAPGRFYSLLPIVGPNIAPTVRDAPPARADVPGAMDELRASFDRHPPVYFVYAPVLPNYDLEQPQFAWLRERIAGEYRFEKAIREYQLYRRIEHSPSR